MIKDILIGIMTGLISGYIVSKYFECKNKKQEIQNDLNSIITSLQLLSYLMGGDNEKTKETSDEINKLITQWKVLLEKVQLDIKERGYKKEYEIIKDILNVLDKIAKESKNAKNDFVKIKNRDIIGIWLKLNEVKDKYN